MKATLFLLLLTVGGAASAQHLKKDGTPDMRYKENKEMYGNTYQYNSSANTNTSYQSYPTYQPVQTPTYNYNLGVSNDRSYNTGGQIYMQSGYLKSDGTYVEPHLKTKPDNQQWNNYNNLYE